MMNPLHGHQCCLLLFFLFAQVYFLSGTKEDFPVVQSPNLILSKRETAQIKCSWNKSPDKITVIWFKNEAKIVDERTNISSQEDSSVLVIHNVSSDDSGLYVCKVYKEIPVLRIYNGTGTQLTVNSQTKTSTENQAGAKNPENERNGLPLQLTVSLAVVVGLLVICAPFIICRIKRTRQQLGNNVIREAPIESEEHGEEVESSSNSSRGSTQWCQVPVYEAYFDHRRDGEDG
ncbi:uncharacterized protein LOC143127449 [Alosa pseudoharengus]|uniref:uncharacterized protein LOC143127449 n=1 Tax=Alosa pseudoharengus TaxID=34774 RepID=UPI003F8B138C